MENYIKNVREIRPLIHHITNYVTVNDCANITLAIGASPIMADAIEEAASIAKIASALVLNIGTLNNRTVDSMLKAGEAANEKNVPIVFDPVGAGASEFRNETVKKIIDNLKPTIIRGNLSEIKYISGLSSNTKGVDAAEDEGMDDVGEIAFKLAEQLNTIIAITGPVDVVSDGRKIIEIHNGVKEMAYVTGTGCMCTSLIASALGANTHDPLRSSVIGIASMGIAGEIALKKTEELGTGSFHISIIDEISKIDDSFFNERASIYERN